MKHQAHLHNSLKVYTRQAAWIEELSTYLNIQFSPKVNRGTFTHFADEPQIKTWEQYVAEAKNDGAFTTLKKYLVQLHFPIEEGISQSEAYRAVTRKGKNPNDFVKALGLRLNQPDALDLQLYPSLAGRIPVLQTANRADFVALVRALSCRNEPIPIPESVGAAMIKGLNNWHRLKMLRSNWQSKLGNHYRSFQDYLHKHQCLYQDRLIVLSRIPYSNVAAHKLGLDHEDWLDKSVQLRLAHECAHYFTLRYFGQMNSHLHDELIADYLGLKTIIPHLKLIGFYILWVWKIIQRSERMGDFFIIWANLHYLKVRVLFYKKL